MTALNLSPLMRADAYKYSHPWQLPKHTTMIRSYIEARGVSGRDWTEMVYFGQQAYLKWLTSVELDDTMINEAESYCKRMGVPFFREGWEHVLKTYEGKFPINIEALPEGMVLPIGTCLSQVSTANEDDELAAFVPAFIETALLRANWYPTTTATESYSVKKKLLNHLHKCADDPWAVVNWMLHDFGARGVSSSESAQIGGAGHLTSFFGTDTIEALPWLDRFYDAQDCVFGSIPASEHSTMTAWGKAREADAYENMITQFGNEKAVFACVSDSYDIYHATREIWGTQLYDKVVELGKRKARLVIRPDSGPATKVAVELLDIIGEKFGYSINNRGYKVLPEFIRVIQGDGMNAESIEELCKNTMRAGWSIDNLTFGMGGGLLQKCNRDTLKFAQKTNEAIIDGKRVEIYKDPVHGGKTSKRGKQVVYRDNNGVIITASEDDLEALGILGKVENLLVPVVHEGRLVAENMSTLSEIRTRINNHLRATL